MPTALQKTASAPRLHVRLPGSAGARLALADQVLVSGSNFVNTVILVRALGLSVFGHFSMLWLVVVFIVALQQALLGQPLLTFVPKQVQGERDAYLAGVLRLALLFTALLAVLTGTGYGFFLSQWDGDIFRGTFWPMLLVVLSKQGHAFLRSAFFATGQRTRAFWNDLLAYPGQPLVLAALWLSGALSLASTLWVIGLFSAGACLVGLYQYEGRKATPAPLGQVGGKHWQFSRWIVVMAVAQWFGSNSYLVAAAALLGSSAVGSIKAAHTVIGVLHLLFLAMENVVPVTAARLLAKEGRSTMLHYLRRTALVGLAGTAGISLVLVLFPHPLLDLLYKGTVTNELVVALRGLAIMCIFAFSISMMNIGLRTIERTRTVFFTYIISTFVAVGLAKPIVSHFGFEGAVYGILGQQAFLALLLVGAWWLELRKPSPEPRSA